MTAEEDLNANLEDHHLSTSLDTASDAVEALFGDSVGHCWGSYSCSYNRIRGRLYATSLAILYYSNLLGFEKKICIFFQDIVEIQLYRTTSIRIFCRDEEMYIFRSFQDRVQVLDLLVSLKIFTDRRKNNNGERSTIDYTCGGLAADRRHGEEDDAEEENNYSRSRLSRSFSASPYDSSFELTFNRRRSASDSVLRIPDDSVETPDVPILESSPIISEPEKEEPLLDDEKEESIDRTWRKARQWNLPSSENHVGIDSLVLPCTLEKFFDTFLADNAPYSFARYQQEHDGDQNVEITAWSNDDSSNVCSRTIRFVHPIKNNGFGMVGPSKARTTRQQRLRRFENRGMLLENTTVVEGIPSADAFLVHDHWLIEASTNDKAMLSSQFGVCFTKRTMFKRLIQKAILKETKEWFSGYSKMLMDVLCENQPTEEKIVLTTPETNTMLIGTTELLQSIGVSFNRVTLLGVILLIFLCVILLIQLWLMHETVVLLREEVKVIRLEVDALVKALESCYNQRVTRDL